MYEVKIYLSTGSEAKKQDVRMGGQIRYEEQDRLLNWKKKSSFTCLDCKLRHHVESSCTVDYPESNKTETPDSHIKATSMLPNVWLAASYFSGKIQKLVKDPRETSCFNREATIIIKIVIQQVNSSKYQNISNYLRIPENMHKIPSNKCKLDKNNVTLKIFLSF